LLKIELDEQLSLLIYVADATTMTTMSIIVVD